MTVMEQYWITECWILEVLGVSLQSHLDVLYSIPVFLLRTTLQTGRFLVPHSVHIIWDPL